MQKQKLNNKGFAHLAIVLVILVLAGVAGAGAYVYHVNHKTNTDTTASTSSSTQPVQSSNSTPLPAPTTPTFSKLPDGWTEYKNDAVGFRLGYPSAWGTLDKTTMHTSYTYRDDSKNLQGPFQVNIYKKDGFKVGAYKYGATIKPSSDGKSWVVVDENPADADHYKVGDTYKAKYLKVNGGTALDLSWVDEECTYTRWLFELKNGYAFVGLPELCPANLQAISPANKVAYSKLLPELLSTVTIY